MVGSNGNGEDKEGSLIRLEREEKGVPIRWVEEGKTGPNQNKGESRSDWERGDRKWEPIGWEKARPYCSTGRREKSSKQGKMVENACKLAGNGVDACGATLIQPFLHDQSGSALTFQRPKANFKKRPSSF